MRIVLVAPPGAGKGTQGTRIAERYGLAHIAAGDLLREHVEQRTDIGRRVEGAVAAGELVPDALVIEMLLDPLRRHREGYVLDGFPRTMAQAMQARGIAAREGFSADLCLHLRADRDELVRRLLRRAQKEGRSDDNVETITARLATYDEATAPLVDYFRGRGILTSLDGMRPVDEVTEDIVERLDRLRAELAARAS